jgi:AraC-like DNA-binding protein
MQATTLLESESLSVYAFRCTAGPADRPFTEMHVRHSISYVRRGSFGCRAGGRDYELVAGALFIGRPGREYTAAHEHHGCGDECLSLKFSPAFADSCGKATLWEAVSVPPVAPLMVLGELAQAAAEGRSSVALDEAALLLAQRFAVAVGGENEKPGHANARERRRAVEAALWLEQNAAEPVGLEDAARQAGLSPFHFLRVFRRVTGVTPHQYLLRRRLARAATLLAQEALPITAVALESGFADLSNFVRTFGRIAGMSPKRFRRAARGERKILQERLAAAI